MSIVEGYWEADARKKAKTERLRLAMREIESGRCATFEDAYERAAELLSARAEEIEQEKIYAGR